MSSRVIDPHIDPLVANREFHPVHRPRRRQSQQLLVQLGVTHANIITPAVTAGSSSSRQRGYRPA